MTRERSAGRALRRGFLAFGLAVGVGVGVGSAGALAAPLVVYDDALRNGFADWSWATHNLSYTGTVQAGSFAVSMEPDGWSGLYFHHGGGLSVEDYESVRFWIRGIAAGGQQLRLVAHLGGSELGAAPLAAHLPGGTLPASWTQVTVSFAAMGIVTGVFDGLILQDASGGNQPPIALDDMVLIENTTPPPPPTPVAISVNPSADRHPINPWIYGVNFGDPSRLGVAGYTVRRWGGNAVTRYNWQIDVTNRAHDYFFQNIPEANDNPGDLPVGSSADRFVAETLGAGAEVLLTVPTIGWAPSPPRVKKWGFSVAEYGPQIQDECDLYPPGTPWCAADAGNGECGASNTGPHCDQARGLIVGNDPHDTSIEVTPAFATGWLQHLIDGFGTGAEGGIRLYGLDNEPMLWNSTHRDVHPAGATYDEVWSRGLAIATAIKAQDPGALVMGPDTWGWCDLFTSAADAALGPSCIDGPDRQAHGGLPFVAWYLQQICAQPAPRPIDFLDVHFYPQGNVSGVGAGSSGEDAATSARRLRSLKELWHPSYVSESWIGGPVVLLPRLRAWRDQYCPGVGIALTEYKWGPDDTPSGALAQAEALGIFGREGLDLATRWVAPDAGSRAEEAFRLYRNYDGAGSEVNGDSVRAVSANVDAVGSYAVREGNTLYLLLFNKDTAARTAEVAVAGGVVGQVGLWRFDASHPLGPAGELPSSPGGFAVDLPARSATLARVALVAPPAALFSDGFESGDTSAWSGQAP